jgi:predicted phosphodiesterase
MKLGLIGDIHAEDERLAATLAVFEREKVDQVLFVGDVVDGRGDVDRCCALLAATKAVGVRGNHERWLLEDRMRTLPNAHHKETLAPQSLALLSSLPRVREIQTPRGLLLLCHGVGEDDMQRLGPDDEGYALESNLALAELVAAKRFAFAVGGHTHERMVRRFGDFVFINAGTLAFDRAPCCSVFDVEHGRVAFFDLEDPSSPRAGEEIVIPVA